MTTYSQFSQESIDNALATAKVHKQLLGATAKSDQVDLAAGGEFSVLAECISVTTSDHKICLNLPLGIGNVCLPIPVSFPDGTAAQACLSICTTWGIPTGVKVTVSVLGVVIVQKAFGKC